jgi:glycosyltransferase involved in cell wall biosynthesis
VSARQDGDARIGVMTLAQKIGTRFGGGERVAYDFVSRLDRERFRPSLCVTLAPPEDRRAANEQELRELEREGVGVFMLGGSGRVPGATWRRLYRVLAHEPVDVLHAHMPRASVPGTILGRLAKVPVIINHEHSWAFQGRPLRRFLDRNVLARGGDLMLAVSEWDRRKMIEVERIPGECIRVIPNGIPRPRRRSDVRGELAPSDAALIGAVGRLYEQKGYDHLIRAVALLRRDFPRPLRCVIVGHGPEEGPLQALIDQLGVGEEVRLIGRRQDIPDVIAALDVAVLSSNWEGLPLAVIEYMAGGAPIVASAVGGVPELIEDGVSGLLVQPGDPGGLALALRRVLDDRELAASLGRAAQERQRADYDLDVVVGRLEELYLELAGAARAARRGQRPNSGIVRSTTERQE